MEENKFSLESFFQTLDEWVLFTETEQNLLRNIFTRDLQQFILKTQLDPIELMNLKAKLALMPGQSKSFKKVVDSFVNIEVEATAGSQVQFI